jgi:hypothetical protein
MSKHRDGCTFDSEGILSPNCEICEQMLCDPSTLDERFKPITDSIYKVCRNCNSTISARINGLYPHGVSLICKCLST